MALKFAKSLISLFYQIQFRSFLEVIIRFKNRSSSKVCFENKNLKKPDKTIISKRKNELFQKTRRCN